MSAIADPIPHHSRLPGAASIRMLASRLASMAAWLVPGLALLAGCASVEPESYARETPILDVKEYFNGTVDAWGIFTDRSGRVVKRFTVEIRCRWESVDGIETGILDEQFIYSDGTRQRRVWTLQKTGPGQFSGTADDVVGTAQGRVAGNALQWRYTLALPVDGRVWNVQFDDWMFLMDSRVMINRAVMSKFGVRLGEVTLSFRKRGD